MSKGRNKAKSSQPPAVSPKQGDMREVRLTRTEVHQGPLPPPSVLSQYDVIVPGLADRIVAQWEKQTDHRISLEKTVVTANIKRANAGLVSGTIVAIAGLAVALVLGLNGQPVVAGIVAGIDIAALAGVFVYGTNSQKKEREDRAKLMAGAPSRGA